MIGAAVLTIILGAIGSGVWEMVAKPGLGRVSRAVFVLVTLGSEKLRNAPYASAALDPTSLAALTVVSLLPLIPFLIASAIIAEQLIRRIEKHLRLRFKDAEKADEPQPALVELGRVMDRGTRRIEKITNVLRVVNILLFFAVSAGGFVEVGVLQAAVAIWRVYHANLRICAPVAASSEVARIESDFAQMKSKEDYDRIQRTLDDIAARQHLKLVTGY